MTYEITTHCAGLFEHKPALHNTKHSKSIQRQIKPNKIQSINNFFIHLCAVVVKRRNEEINKMKLNRIYILTFDYCRQFNWLYLHSA